MLSVKVFAPELYEPRRNYRSKERDQQIRERHGVDPAITADELGLTEMFVRRYERKLGLRGCMQNPRKGDCHDSL